jgi:hypothetical protein
MDRAGRQGKVMGKVVSSHFHLFTYCIPSIPMHFGSLQSFASFFSCQYFHQSTPSFLSCVALIITYHTIYDFIWLHIPLLSVISYFLYSIPSPIFPSCLGHRSSPDFLPPFKTTRAYCNTHVTRLLIRSQLPRSVSHPSSLPVHLLIISLFFFFSRVPDSKPQINSY